MIHIQAVRYFSEITQGFVFEERRKQPQISPQNSRQDQGHAEADQWVREHQLPLDIIDIGQASYQIERKNPAGEQDQPRYLFQGFFE